MATVRVQLRHQALDTAVLKSPEEYGSSCSLFISITPCTAKLSGIVHQSTLETTIYFGNKLSVHILINYDVMYVTEARQMRLVIWDA